MYIQVQIQILLFITKYYMLIDSETRAKIKVDIVKIIHQFVKIEIQQITIATST